MPPVDSKGARILRYQRIGPLAEIANEQIVSEIRYPMCGFMEHIKERPFVTCIDLLFGGPLRGSSERNIGWHVATLHARREVGHYLITVLQLKLIRNFGIAQPLGKCTTSFRER